MKEYGKFWGFYILIWKPYELLKAPKEALNDIQPRKFPWRFKAVASPVPVKTVSSFFVSTNRFP